MSFFLLLALLIQTFTFLAKANWIFELFTHYAPYYAAIALIFMLLALRRRHFRHALIWITLACINFAPLAPYLTTPKPPSTEAPTLTLLSQNFYYKNTNLDEFVALIHEENPDILLVHEASSIWKTAKEKFRNDYPYLHLTHLTGIHGILIASRIPGTFKEVPLGAQVGLVFTPDDLSYQILAVHPDAPLSSDWAQDRKAQFQEIARLAHTSPVPLIVMGDFNCTPWSPYFRDLLKNSDLTDSRLGFGLLPTWHAHNPLFQLPIDHALISRGIKVQNFKTTPSISSDHRGILLEVAFPASLGSPLSL